MTISKRARAGIDSGSQIRALFEAGLALKNDGTGKPVFDLSLGNPQMAPPTEFFEEARHLLENPTPGAHGYMPNNGLPQVRASVAASLSLECGVPFEADHIYMTAGAAGAINLAMFALLDPGDQVVVNAPFFVEYGHYVANRGATLVTVSPTENFDLNLDGIEHAITPQTRMVLINNPNNPTGVCYPESTLKELGSLLRRASRRIGHPITLLDDAPYRHLVYNGRTITPAEVYDRSLLATSHSKDLSLAGERIGYLAISPSFDEPALLPALCVAARALGFVNAPALMQRVLPGLHGVTVDLAAYKRKRDRIHSALCRMGYQVVKPQGAFYLFPKINTDETDEAFVARARENRLLVVPGSAFGAPGYFRIAYCTTDIIIEGALSVLWAMNG